LAWAPLRTVMETADLAKPLLAGGAGVAVAALASVGVPAVLALATGIVATAGCCVLLCCRRHAVPAGLVGYVGLGVVTLVPGVPPTYDPAIGAAVLASGLLAGLGVEVGTRAGAVLAAGGSGDADYGGVWLVPAAGIAGPVALWRLGTAGQVLVGSVLLAVVGTHVGVVALGAAAVHQASTLVPLALLGFLAFPLVDTVAYVSPGPAGSLVAAARGGGRGTGSNGATDASPETNDGAAGSRAGERTTRNGTTPGPTRRDGPAGASGGRATNRSERRPASDRGPERTADREDGGNRPSDWHWLGGAGDEEGTVTDDSGTADSGSSGDAGSSGDTGPPAEAASHETEPPEGTTPQDGTRPPAADARPACQNCGSEAEDREARFVVVEPACTVVLCPDCQDRRADVSRARTDCRGREVHGAVADAAACAACGEEGGALEAHPIVPLGAGGHRHPNNVLALCVECHAAVEDHRIAGGTPDLSGQR